MSSEKRTKIFGDVDRNKTALYRVGLEIFWGTPRRALIGRDVGNSMQAQLISMGRGEGGSAGSGFFPPRHRYKHRYSVGDPGGSFLDV